MARDDVKTAEQMAADLKADFSKSTDAVKAIAEEALGKVKSGEKVTEKMKDDADAALVKLNELTEEVKEMAQKMARGGDVDEVEAKTLGARFVNDENVKSWLAQGPRQGKADLCLKATLTMATTDAAGSVGPGADRQRLPGIVTGPERRMTIRDLLTQGQMSEASISWIQETGFTNNAGMVAEGVKKGESDIKLAEKTSVAKVVAHWMKVSRQALDDVDQLRGHIDGRLLYGLALKEENQILNGDGTGQNLDGIVTQASAYSAEFAVSDETPIDKMRLAMLQAVLAEYPATGHVMHPIDWARIELTKDADKRHIIGDPQGGSTPMLWRLPVVETQSMSVDKFLTGAFAMGAQLWDRWDARVEVGYENDDFTKNLVTILAEERLALTVYRPEAFITGDFGNVT
jgi:HK97 family phage major capsid protein